MVCVRFIMVAPIRPGAAEAEDDDDDGLAYWSGEIWKKWKHFSALHRGLPREKT